MSFLLDRKRGPYGPLNRLFGKAGQLVSCQTREVVDGERIVEPVTGEPYLDREASFDYKIEKGDLCYNLFIEHGFEWGGEWPDRKDYQHFAILDSKIAEWYPENVG